MAARTGNQERRLEESDLQAYLRAKEERAVAISPLQRRRNRRMRQKRGEQGRLCTLATPRCADARDYDTELRPCCRQMIVDISREVAAALDAAGVTYWIDYGTLLGAVRNPLTTWADYPWLPQVGRPEGHLAPGIIPHDKDADWGVMGSQWAEAFNAIRKGCFRRDLKIRQPQLSIKVRASHVNHTNLDLFFWYEHPRQRGLMQRHRYVSVDAYKGKHFNRADLFPLQPLEWEGLQLPAPKDPEAWLAFRYGPNWMTPIPANNDGVRR